MRLTSLEDRRRSHGDTAVALELRDADLAALQQCADLVDRDAANCGLLSKRLLDCRVAELLLRHVLLEQLLLSGVLSGLTRQFLLHRLRLRLVVEPCGSLRLTVLLRLTSKVGLLCGHLLLEVLRGSLILHLLLRGALPKNLLQRLVLRFGLSK